MTPQDHNKTLCLIYGFLSAVFILLLLASPFIINNNVGDPHSPISTGKLLTIIVIFCIILLPTLLLLFTAYGLYKRKRWVRVTASILAILFVWSFPLGTALAVYTWWFIHSEGSKQLFYGSPS
jgi:hypothetical protein